MDTKAVISFFVMVMSLFLGSQYVHAQPYSCLPTCSTDDSRFLMLIEANPVNGLHSPTMNFSIVAPMNSNNVEIGIFDGDAAGNWDLPTLVIRATLYADPQGDGTGTIVLRQWLDADMINNDWLSETINHVPEALAEDGNYKYNLLVESVNPIDPVSRNQFKIRTDGSLLLLPFQIFAFNSILSEQNDFETVFPDISLTEPSCFVDGVLPPPFVGFCDARVPSCCLNVSTYDGNWSFYFLLPESQDRIFIWDGDFDFGGSVLDEMGNCISDGVNIDTDDPNTGPIIPPFSPPSANAVDQGASTPTVPEDDLCSDFAPRSPSVVYDLIDPNGVVHTNVNPSGNQEWEIFSLTTVQPLDPVVDDLLVEDIPPGLWQVRTRGLDIFNVNLFYFNYPIIGVNEDGDPVLPPAPSRNVPALSNIGLIILAFIMFLVSVVYFARPGKT